MTYDSIDICYATYKIYYSFLFLINLRNTIVYRLSYILPSEPAFFSVSLYRSDKQNLKHKVILHRFTVPFSGLQARSTIRSSTLRIITIRIKSSKSYLTKIEFLLLKIQGWGVFFLFLMLIIGQVRLSKGLIFPAESRNRDLLQKK